MKILNYKAFTLIELIMVVAVIAILVTVLFVSTKPQKRFGETNDAKRKNDAQSLEQAIKLVTADTGSLPAELNITENQALAIVKAGGSVSGTYSCAVLGSSINKVDLAAAVSSVLPTLPMDPELSSASNETGYYIIKRGRAYDIEPCNTYELAATSGDKQMCGDGYCGSSESCSSCAQDCGVCPGPQSYTVGPNYPVTGADGGVGSYPWTSPTNVVSDNGVYVSRSSVRDNYPVWYDSAVQIIKSDGSYGSTNKSTGAAFPYVTDAVTTYGGEADLWGETWTPADIMDADFGVAFKAVGGAITTNYLKATNFGFNNIPVGATINGIKVEIDKSYYGGPSNSYGRVDYIKITVYYTN